MRYVSRPITTDAAIIAIIVLHIVQESSGIVLLLVQVLDLFEPFQQKNAGMRPLSTNRRWKQASIDDLGMRTVALSIPQSFVRSSV